MTDGDTKSLFDMGYEAEVDGSEAEAAEQSLVSGSQVLVFAHEVVIV